MEVKAGYKLTDVGVIPEEWEVRRLDEISTVTAGGTPSRTVSAYWDGEIPWITTSQIGWNTITEAEQFISDAGLKNSAASLLPVGTLLMALYGQGKTRGKAAILGIEASTNQACAAISLDRGVSREFVFHYLVRQYEAIRALSNTGNQDNLNGQLVRSILIPIPSLPEQQAIAAALGDVDALLASLDRLIAKKRDLKQAAARHLLTGEKRLPSFKQSAGHKQTEVGSIPGEWEVVTVRTAGEVLGGRQRSPHQLGKLSKYLRVANVFDGYIDTTDVLEMPFTANEKERYLLRPGDILLNEGQSIDLVGRSAVYRGAPADCCYQNTLIRFRSSSETNPDYAQLVFQSFLSRGVFA